MSKQHKTKQGFTIYETMIAAFVLVVGIVAALGLIGSSIRQSQKNRDFIIGSGLAQEGIELVRNLRDNDLVNSRPFGDSITGKSGDIFYDNTGSFSAAGKLRLSSGYFYGDAGTISSKFYREVSTSSLSNGEITVTSKVWWTADGSEPGDCSLAKQCVATEDILVGREQ
ncbi:hypothetical protein EPO05_05250 [Patescibacteria group bacterium]|nr:MAG: hypothetical protein EPO05_05250 [Patescibacteria group bacterium]